MVFIQGKLEVANAILSAQSKGIKVIYTSVHID